MLDWFYPQTVAVYPSPINGPVKVTRSRGRYSVWVSGFEQSGDVYVRKVWEKALGNVAVEQCNQILVLGLGCGTVVPLTFQKWPKAKIVGVEIDPVMITLGKKYFGLDKYQNLKVVQADALDYVNTLKSKFALILVDAYVANKKVALPDLKGHLTKNGAILINNLIGLKTDIMIKYQGGHV